MKKFLNNKIIKYFSFLGCLILPLLIEKFVFPNEGISIDRYIIFATIFLFCRLNIYIDRNKLWDFIYRKRYILGLIIFSYCVINGYHGSSISMYNEVVQPNIYVKNSNPFLFKPQLIRGDEWAVTTPFILSQKSKINNLSTINKTIRGTNNIVTLYPKLPVKSITILSNPTLIPFLFLDVNHAFSAYWYLGYFAMFFATFELFMLMTKQNKKYSLLGAVMITFAPATQWWESYNIITYGCLAILMFNKFLENKIFKKKVLYSFLIGFFGSCYIMCLYPAWQISYGYFFLALVIWQLATHKNEINIKNFLILILNVLLICAIIIAPSFITSTDVLNLVNNTVYPGARFSTGGSDWQHLFNYITSIFTPFVNHPNASESSQFISLYPLPLLVAICTVISNIKNKKKDLLLILLVVFTLFLNLWNFIEINDFFAKITLLYMSTPIRTQVTVGFLNVVLLIYILANYAINTVSIKKILISCLLSVILFMISFKIVNNLYTSYFTSKMFVISMLIFIPIMTLFLINYIKADKYLVCLLFLLSCIVGMTIHPVSKGLSVIYDKPFAEKVREIVNHDNDGKWLTIGTVYYLQNYILANGAKVINSTNNYPNYELWDILDKERKYDNIYNRYAHINVNIIDETTNVELLYEDALILNINKYDLCDIKAKYLVTNGLDLSIYNDKDLTFDEIYNYDYSNIYRLSCN